MNLRIRDETTLDVPAVSQGSVVFHAAFEAMV